MNRYRVLRRAACKGMSHVANRAGIDVMQLALFESHMGHVQLATAYRLAEVIGEPMGDVFPLLRSVFLASDALDDRDEKLSVLFAQENRTHLAESGIDPDELPWFAVVSLKSGNERRYFLTSMEHARIRADLLESDTSEGFLTFISDCQSVILRKKAISSVRFSNDASYAYFASHERGCVVTIVSDACPRPVMLETAPDGDHDGKGPRPFAELFRSAREGGADMPPFLSLVDAPAETIVSLDGVEALEIPFGVTMPELYDDGEPWFPDPVSQDEAFAPDTVH